MTQPKDTTTWLETAPHKRQTLSSDLHRPQYHFLPPNNWMNDPNGLMYWKGQYHMFYQHNPNNPFWGDIHWGHAVSDDLVHWKDLSLALTPDMPPVDNDGCWSGCAVNDNGVPTILYTGVKDGEQTTCIATGNDDLTRWQKDKSNPVQTAPQLPSFHYKDYRDPFVWRKGEVWYKVISMTINHQGNVLLYRSNDLRNWEYLHPLIPAEVRQTIQDEADIWECPNFFPLENKWVLIVSIWKNHVLLYPAAYIGEFKNLHFYPESYQRLDWGIQCMYAPLTFEANNRRLFFGWMQEQRSKDVQIKAGWSGVMSLPRELGLENNVLKSTPAIELQSLRGESFELSNTSLDSEMVLPVEGGALEILLDLSLSKDAVFKLKLGTQNEQTTLTYDAKKSELSLDTTGSSLNEEAVRRLYSAPHKIKDNRLQLHIFLDRSAIEIFADYTTCLTARIYPATPDHPSIILISEKTKLAIQRLNIWKIKSIWDF
jgi:beta-fructofuranosidase